MPFTVLEGIMQGERPTFSEIEAAQMALIKGGCHPEWAAHILYTLTVQGHVRESGTCAANTVSLLENIYDHYDDPHVWAEAETPNSEIIKYRFRTQALIDGGDVA
jgi:hypothetical protein